MFQIIKDRLLIIKNKMGKIANFYNIREKIDEK